MKGYILITTLIFLMIVSFFITLAYENVKSEQLLWVLVKGEAG
jgi:hypothetical protein